MEVYPKDESKRHAFWINQLKMAQQFMEPYLEAGVRLTKMYNNMPATMRETILSAATNKQDNDERVKASKVFSWVDQSVSGMVGDGEVEFQIKPKNLFGVKGAPVVKSNCDYWYKETEQVVEDEAIALDAHLMPFAVKKLGWTFDVDENEELKLLDFAELVFTEPEDENLYLAEGTPTRVERDQDHKQHIAINEELLKDKTIPQEIKDLIIKPHVYRHKQYRDNIQPESHSLVRFSAPFGRRWPVDDFLIDPAALIDQRDAGWIAFRIRQRVYRWKANANYSNTSNLKPNCGIAGLKLKNWAQNQKQQPEEFSEYGLCEGWEIWARDFPVGDGERENLLVVLIETHPKLLQHEPWPEEYNVLDDYPCEIVKFQDNIKTWINKPTLVLAGADNLQSLQNEFLDSMLYTMRKAKNIYMADAEIYDSNKLSNITEAPDGSVVRVEGLAGLGGQGVQAWPQTQIANDKQNMVGIINNLFDQSAGTPEPLRNKSSDTATEAAIIERRNTAREDRRFLRFRRMQINTARKWWQLQTQIQPESTFIDPRTNREMQVTADVARGEYRFTMDVMPKRMSESVQQSNEMKFYNMIAGTMPLMVQLGVAFNLQAVIEDMLIAFGKKDLARYLPSANDEFVQALQAQLDDPVQRAALLERLQSMPAVGGSGMGGSPGPAIPQMQTSQPMTEARQMSESNNLNG